MRLIGVTNTRMGELFLKQPRTITSTIGTRPATKLRLKEKRNSDDMTNRNSGRGGDAAVVCKNDPRGGRPPLCGGNLRRVFNRYVAFSPIRALLFMKRAEVGPEKSSCSSSRWRLVT
jgi:hypothetical protein